MQLSFKFRTLEEESNMDRYTRITNEDSIPTHTKNKVNNYNLTLVQIAKVLECNITKMIKASKLEAEGPSDNILSQAMAHTIVLADDAFSIEALREELITLCHMNTIARTKIEEYLRKYKEDSFRFEITLNYKEQYCPYEVTIAYDKRTKVNITPIAMLNKYHNIDLDKYKEITEIKSEYGA
ncbi:hypothetical protein JDFnp1_120 [Fusobacterium phage JD-Fnp1]|nr:hypothetical protein JDFnp1_120 [Fusobacterium phage JD-Fnp1]